MDNVHTRRTNKINDVIISHHPPTIYYNYTTVSYGVKRRGDGRVMCAGSGAFQTRTGRRRKKKSILWIKKIGTSGGSSALNLTNMRGKLTWEIIHFQHELQSR